MSGKTKTYESDRCEWCDKRATHRIRVPSHSEGGSPYTRYACDEHEGKTQRLVSLDFGQRLSAIPAEVSHSHDGRFLN